MGGALKAGGQVAGILANGLEEAAMRREHRPALMDGQLVLASPYDPAARFYAGHAMQRNKLIYALSDAALVVNSDFNRGGTWTGAAEQLDKLKLVPVYVRSTGESARGLEELRTRGARAWPNPAPDALRQLLDAAPNEPYRLEPVPPSVAASGSCPADQLFAAVAELIERMDKPVTDASLAKALQVPKTLANAWRRRFFEEQARGLFESANVSKTEAEVAELLGVAPPYARSRLRSLVSRGELVKDKVARPLRYRLLDDMISPAK